MRLHVLGLPWTETTRRYLHCAYTQKVLKFCDMMSRDYEVVLYAGEENEAACAEHVPIISRQERIRWFGEWDEDGLFGNIDWNPASAWWQAFNGRAIAEVVYRAEPHDVLALVTGTQAPVARALPNLMSVEWAVGYEGVQLPRRVFESYAWMHYVYGREAAVRREFVDYNPFDAVIPNFFDPADFDGSDRQPDDYLLFLGRLVWRKGPQAAAAIADRLGMRLVVAGPGARHVGDGRVELATGEGEIVGKRLEYVGPVGRDARRELLAGAAATIVPTLYAEPFGGVAVEAMMSGSPVVASDWGAFCVPTDAEILTRSGWLHHDEICADDQTLGYDPARGELAWTPIERVNVFRNQQTTEYRNRNWRIRITDGHRWSAIRAGNVETLASFEELGSSRDRVRLAAEAPGGSLTLSARDAALIGWLLTDGSIETRQRQGTRRAFDWESDPGDLVGKARVWQSKPMGLAALRGLLEDVPHMETTRSKEPTQLERYVFQIAPSYVRDVVEKAGINESGFSGFVLGLSRAARAAFLRACIEAEGWTVSRGSTTMISQNEGPLLDAIALCAYLCGFRPTISANGQKNRAVALCNPLIAPIRLHVSEGRREDVWCPTTILGTWTMRFDGHIVLTGNTETVPDGVGGYRFRTLAEGARAVERALELDRSRVRHYAVSRYSLDAVYPSFDAHFGRLDQLWRDGWYE